MLTIWFDITLTTATFFLPLLCLFEGTRQASAFGLSRKSVLLIFAGLIPMLGQLGYGYWAHQFQERAIALLSKGPNLPVLSPEWGQDLTPENRVILSTELARTAFHDHGHLQTIFDQSGAPQTFVPTVQDLKEREQKVASLAELKAAAKDTALLPTRIIITTILVALFGFVFCRANRLDNPSP